MPSQWPQEGQNGLPNSTRKRIIVWSSGNFLTCQRFWRRSRSCCPKPEKVHRRQYDGLRCHHDCPDVFTIRAETENFYIRVSILCQLRQCVTPALWQLREWRQNLWHVKIKKFPEDHTMVRFLVGFVSSSDPSCGHRDGILSHRVVFVFSSCNHRCHRVLFASGNQYEGNKKLPDCRRKATRLREAFALPSWSPRIKEIYSTMTSRWDYGVYEDDRLLSSSNVFDA